ncbi:hypothetical protein N7450_010149 [Penicillium hetheringtonii]|uniref:Uncharacterized protein n=1 Tax=Penicillium hetheringtonii TaxID=911720 RepID=A0AAD6DED4_9EURO|nr:hypothetical protein N7450_010149 [Penicillium hetheringtonii]
MADVSSEEEKEPDEPMTDAPSDDEDVVEIWEPIIWNEMVGDFTVSYVKEVGPEEPKKPRVREYDIPREPIHNMKDVPKGWSPLDDDIDPSNVDAQIQRCEERISENIMPSIFKGRLKLLKKRRRKERELIESEPKGLSWNVVQRLQELKGIKKFLQAESDPYNHLSSVKAVMKAYSKRFLHWNHGLVTYWHEGTMLCSPRPRDIEVLKLLVSEEEYKTGLWVEGGSSHPSRLPGNVPPGPVKMNAARGNQYRFYPRTNIRNTGPDNGGVGVVSASSALCFQPEDATGPFQIKMNMRLKTPLVDQFS